MGSLGLAIFTATIRVIYPAAIVQVENYANSIVNGTVVTNPSSTYPFFALPSRAVGDSTWLGCGASIISQKYGLSSAHCFGGGLAPCSGPHAFDLWLGDVEIVGFKIVPKVGGKSASVRVQLECSSDFNGKCSHGHDVAVLKLLDVLPKWVTPAKLNLEGTALDKVGATVNIIGYGMTESKTNPTVLEDSATVQLVHAQVVVQSQTTSPCKTVYAGGYGCSDSHSEGAAKNLEQQFCAAAVKEPLTDSCPGDSGAPVLDSSGTQIGLVSYGGGPGEATSGPNRMCGNPLFPGIYARISSAGIRKFICEKTDILCSTAAFETLVESEGGVHAVEQSAALRPAGALVRRGVSVHDHH